MPRFFYALGYRPPPAATERADAVVLVCRFHGGLDQRHTDSEPPEDAATGRDGTLATSTEATVSWSAELVAETLSGGPDFARRVEALVGDGPIVGFDLPAVRGHLNLGSLRTTWIDLLDLGSLLEPGLAAYSRDSLCEALGLASGSSADDSHALARLSAEVYLALVDGIEQLDLDLLTHLNRIAAPLDWPPKRLFSEAARHKRDALLAASEAEVRSSPSAAAVPAGPAAASERERLVPREGHRRIDPERLATMLTEDGAFGLSLSAFEERPEQQAMVRRVAEAFNEGGALLVEAGTGTGKSLAYLLPAAHFAVANSRRVVISTNTINLQDQLFRKDVPEVQRATGLPLRVSVLKGRTNYLCLRRWYALLRAEQLEPHERTLLIKTLLWVPHTRTGDRAELRFSGREEEAWARMSASPEVCTAQHCQFHRAGVCYLARARREAEASHLVVVNHALLLADAVSNNSALPDYDYLVLDEAHHLEQEATTQFGWRTSYRELLSRLNVLLEPQPGHPSGLVRETLRLLWQRGAVGEPPPQARRERAGGRPADGLSHDLATIEQQFLPAVQRLREALGGLFVLLADLLEERGQRADGQAALRLSSSVHAQPVWSQVEVAWDEASGRVGRLVGLLARLLDQVEQSISSDAEDWEEIVGGLGAQLTHWERTGEHLGGALVERRPDLISWLSRGRTDDLFVNTAPLHVGPLLRESLFDSRSATILTSATLSTDGHFGYVKERLSLQDADELALGSTFDYQNAALVYVPSDIPEPTQPGYQERVQEVVLAVATALGGRCLVLFTSYAQLRSTYQALREPVAVADVHLLAQAQDGASRATLLEALKADQRTVLLGTSSFWEGVDVVGPALSCVVIPRLPFSVPSDPIFEARSEAFDDPFRQYAVPQAILRFKQGFGRLIRSRGDRGAVVLLDRRVDSKFYGRSFLRSLPGCTIRREPLAEAAQVVREWLGGPPPPDNALHLASLSDERVTSERRSPAAAREPPH